LIGDYGDLSAKDSKALIYGGGSAAAFVPYWVILIGFALPWTALLVWRAKRRRRSPHAIGEALSQAQ